LTRRLPKAASGVAWPALSRIFAVMQGIEAVE